MARRRSICRICVGESQSASERSGLTSRALGDQVGVESHQLTTAQIPAHTHSVRGTLAATVSASGVVQNDPSLSRNSLNTGGGGTHNNMQPTLIMNYIIKV